MIHRKSFVFIMLLGALAFAGCGGGGGGGGDGSPAGSNAPAQLTINGDVTASELNDGLLPASSILAKAGDQIDFGVLTIQVEGDDATKTALSGTGKATFKLAVTTLSNTALKLVVKNKAGNVLLARALYGLALGDTKATTLDATSTAIVTLMTANAGYSASELEAQVSLPGFQTLVAALRAAWKNSTSGSPLDDAAVKAAAAGLQVGVQGGESQIKQAYADMKAALENNSLTDAERLNAFMGFISKDFKDIAGTPSYDDLRSVTESRLQRYTINTYSFTGAELSYTATDTIELTTNTYIDVTRKPGATGGVSGVKITVTPTPKIIWKFNGTKWLIQQGLPYKQSEIKI
ncbi:hypothetical protein AUK22_11800 [bacterium CG2_30_54_10]|nr:MAG: hypothetical protein AUK22_11800 [bacterium CG2_30_54_10]